MLDDFQLPSLNLRNRICCVQVPANHPAFGELVGEGAKPIGAFREQEWIYLFLSADWTRIALAQRSEKTDFHRSEADNAICAPRGPVASGSGISKRSLAKG